MMDLSRIMGRQTPKMNNSQQQNQVRRGGGAAGQAARRARAGASWQRASQPIGLQSASNWPALTSPPPGRAPPHAALQTRWAVYQAGTLLRSYAQEYEALQEAMTRGASVVECIQAIEAAGEQK